MFRFPVPKSDSRPRVAVLGGFVLSNALQHRHEAQLVEGLAAAGYPVTAVTQVPGGFPVTHLRNVPRVDRAILFLRCFANTPRGEDKWSERGADWKRLSALVRGTRRSVVLFDRPWRSRSGALQAAAAVALKLRHPFKLRLRLNGPPPERLLALLGLRSVAVLPHVAAQNRLFARLLRANPTGLPLADIQIERALEASAAGSDLRMAMAELQRHAAQLPRHIVRDALTRVRMAGADKAPFAIAPALEDDGGAPRLVRHLLGLGENGPAPRSYVPASDRPVMPPGPCAAFVQFVETGTCARPGHAAWLAAPLAPDTAPLTRFEWLLALVLRLPIQSLAGFRQPWAVADWRHQLVQLLPPDHPGLGVAPQDPPVITLHGEAQSQTGLGLNLEMSRQALRLADIPHRLAEQPLAAQDIPTAARQLRRPAALYHLNADRVPQEIFDRYRFAETYHIGFALWELDRLPQTHLLALDMLDEIWAPSVFVAKTYRRQFRGKVMLMRKGLPKIAAKPRLPKPGVIRFVVAFDAHSSVCRKNPLAALRAFQAAFGPRRDVELVIKTTPAPAGHWGDPEGQMAQIERAAAIDRRIRLIREHWPMNGLMGLIGGAAALVSPHRAEGFGYLPAFALSMGVPVIATDYSGTRDFCTEETAFPVPYDLVAVRPGQAIHPTPGARWADIDIGALAETMRQVADSPEEARRRAALGQRRVALDYSIAAQARRYGDRLTALGILTPRDLPIDATALDAMFTSCS